MSFSFAFTKNTEALRQASQVRVGLLSRALPEYQLQIVIKRATRLQVTKQHFKTSHTKIETN